MFINASRSRVPSIPLLGKKDGAEVCFSDCKDVAYDAVSFGRSRGPGTGISVPGPKQIQASALERVLEAERRRLRGTATGLFSAEANPSCHAFPPFHFQPASKCG